MVQEQSELDQQQKDFEKNAMRPLEDEEKSLWTQYRYMDFEQLAFEEVRDIALAQYDLLDEHTVKTEKQNCLSDVFKISHQGEFGIINSFRLGRTSMVHVEWNEINTGFGESAFLLQTLADILNAKFTE